MKKKLNFCLSLFILLASAVSIHAQEQWLGKLPSFTKQFAPSHKLQFPFSVPISATQGPSTSYSLSGPYVPKAYNYQELAFFCKLEVKMEKSTKLPIKVRLGDVDYVDWLEGKRERY